MADRVYPRYAVIGTGALGGFYGGLLSRSGQEVHFLLRSDFEYVREHGLHIESPKGDILLQPILAHANVDSIPKCDVVVVALKSTQNHLLPSLLPPIVHDRSIVVVLQNGLHVEEATAAIVGHRRTIGGCCFLCSNKVGPGHIRHLDYGRIILGAYRGTDNSQPAVDDAILHGIAEDFQNASIDVQVTEHFAQARWKKLMWNIPFNGLSVVLNASTAELMRAPMGRQMALEIMQEVRSIACQCGHMIDESVVDKMMSDTDKMVPYDSSMRLDYLAGRPMEVEAIFGNPLRAAEAIGAKPLRLRILWQQLSFLNRSSFEKEMR